MLDILPGITELFNLQANGNIYEAIRTAYQAVGPNTGWFAATLTVCGALISMGVASVGQALGMFKRTAEGQPKQIEGPKNR